MAKITGILCQVLTGNVSDAQTDGDIYLGLGGREFHLDSKENDFQRASAREYLLGEPPIPPFTGVGIQQIHVLNEDKNDPRKGFPLDTDDLALAPVYIRFEPEPQISANDHWNLKFAAVLVYDQQFFIGYVPSRAFDNLWLGHQSGKILYLTDDSEFAKAEAKLLAKGRKLAAQMK